VRAACDPAIFTNEPSAVAKLVAHHLGTALRPRSGATSDLDVVATVQVLEGDISFQRADELYGDGATKALRLELLRLVVKASAPEVAAMRNALDRCTGRPGDGSEAMMTWKVSGRHLISLDDAGPGRVELSASVDQSDGAE
jgi:hypothetical protein